MTTFISRKGKSQTTILLSLEPPSGHFINESLKLLSVAHREVKENGCSWYCTKMTGSTSRDLIGIWLLALFYPVSNFFESFNAKLSQFNKSFKQFSLVYVCIVFVYT